MNILSSPFFQRCVLSKQTFLHTVLISILYRNQLLYPCALEELEQLCPVRYYDNTVYVTMTK